MLIVAISNRPCLGERAQALRTGYESEIKNCAVAPFLWRRSSAGIDKLHAATHEAQTRCPKDLESLATLANLAKEAETHFMVVQSFAKAMAISTDCLDYQFDGLRYLSLAEAAFEAIREFRQEKENA